MAEKEKIMEKTGISADIGMGREVFGAAAGKMRFTLKNDYLFRATMQMNNKALKGLICAVLGLSAEEVASVRIQNPIELGRSIEAKDFLLDIKVLLNSNTIVNLEMQLINMGNWPERSMIYLCRSFDNVNRGEDYLDVVPVMQVCFLDFTLFEKEPEFLSTYMFLNIKNHIIYSDKLKLFVIDLTQIEKATEEDRMRGIDRWAKLFKATTWEEIRMLSEGNEFLKEAAETAYRLSAEEKIRLQCQAREDFYREQNTIKAIMKRNLEEIARGKETIARNQEEIARNQEELAQSREETSNVREKLIQTQEELVKSQEEVALLMKKIAELERAR